MSLIEIIFQKFEEEPQKNEILAKFKSDGGFNAIQKFSDSKNLDIQAKYGYIMDKDNMKQDLEMEGNEMQV